MKAGTLLGTGAASTVLRASLETPRKPGRVLASFPAGIYIELRADEEPRVIAVVRDTAIRLPNALVLSKRAEPVLNVATQAGDDVQVGEGIIDLGDLLIRVRRWWDPKPALPPLNAETLAAGTAAFAESVTSITERRCGIRGFPAVDELAGAAERGDLLAAITAAEALVGLGPGLTPSGDDMLAGLLVSLRVLGTATGNARASYLADWLGAAVTYDARRRTTPLSATLLHCAAKGLACAEATAVLAAIADRRPLEAPTRRLLSAGHTSGADLAWGLLTGCRAVLSGVDR